MNKKEAERATVAPANIKRSRRTSARCNAWTPPQHVPPTSDFSR